MFLLALMLSAVAASASPPPGPSAAPPPPPPALRIKLPAPWEVREQTPQQREESKRRSEKATACRRAFIGQDYLPQPAIWKLSDADTTLYLFGTIHQLPISFDWRSAQMDQIISEAGSLITETGVRKAGGQSSMDEWLQKAAAPPPPPIAQRVGGKRRAKWLGMAAMMPETARSRLDSMPSWMAAMTIAIGASRYVIPAMGAGVDDQLEQTFGAAKKPITAIEDSYGVTVGVSRMGPRDQQRMLNEALDEVGHPRTLAERMKSFHQWARGDHSPDRGWTKAEGASSAKVFLRERLLDTRNAAWADTLQRRMSDPGVVLVAVGAGHLAGKGSLLELLAAKGLAAERVSPTGPARSRPAFLPRPTAFADCSRYQFGDMLPHAQ